MLVRLTGVHKVRRKLASGETVTYYYAWRGGPRVNAKPGTDAFTAEVLRHKEPPKPKANVASLIGNFMERDGRPNPDWLALAETTRRDHEYAFRLINDEWGEMALSLTQQPGMKARIRAWHRGFSANPRKADKLLLSFSKLFSYAVEHEVVRSNPCAGIPRIYSGSRRDHIWSDEQVSLFRRSAAPQLLLPFEIAICTGQRQGDILRLAWPAYDGTYLRFDQSKTGVRLKVKVAAALKTILDGMPRDKLRICLNSRGRPWTADGFKTTWGRECARLGIQNVTFHDLRGTFITERHREGASVEDIGLISGHSNAEIRNVLRKHYLAPDQTTSDKVIARMDRTQRKRKL